VAVQLIKSPIGHKLGESTIEGVIIDDGTGDALVYTGFAHSLTDGDYIYIESNFDSYNGYKYVDSISYDTFKIRDSENSDNTAFIQDADISYRVSVLNHGWQCVHLPIVYELESDIYPNNVAEEEYTPTTIISQSEEGGLTRLALSVGITDATERAKIQLFGDNDLAGVYQIVTVYNAWNIVIDLPYDSANSFDGLQVIKYYDNYTINVRVWAGLSAEHRWEDRQPFEIAATLQLIPDQNNMVKFSISEVLRSYVKTRNNLTLDTLPNNLDFMISFYIQYFETYDQSDGETITTYEGGPLTDDFVGYAVNAKLPFKSESISHMSDYINQDVYLAQWLTLQQRPIAVVGRFFDLSFINQFNSIDLIVTIDKYLNDSLVEQELLTIENPGYGIIRVPFTPISGTDEYCIEVNTNGTPASGGVSSAMAIPALSTWLTRSSDPSLVDWTTGAAPQVTVPGTGPGTPGVSEILYTPFTFISGYTYSITITYTKTYNSGTSNPRVMHIEVYDNSFNVLHTELETTPPSPGAAGSGTLTFEANGTETQIGVDVRDGSNITMVINTATGTQTTPLIPEVTAQQITERICLDIIEECESTFIETTDDIRLTEDGDFRILE
jgi:uncharacterized protein YaiI (UPF0178 family)